MTGRQGLIACSAAMTLVCGLACGCAGEPESETKTPTTTQKSTEVTLTPEDIATTIDTGNLSWSLDELITASEVIVVGKVVDILESKRGESVAPSQTGTVIYTDVLLEVRDYLYGGSGAKTIAVHLEGGRIGNEVVVMSHGPVFTTGETALLFLYRPAIYPLPTPPEGIAAADYFEVTGFARGQWPYDNGVATPPEGDGVSLSQIVGRIDTLRVKMSESAYQSTDFSQYHSYRARIGDLNWLGMSTEEVIQESDLILVGEVIAIRPSGRAAAGQTLKPIQTAVYTDVIIRPVRYLCGDTAPGDIAIRMPCGRLGNETWTVDGYVSFTLGEQTLLCLRRGTGDGLTPYLPVPPGIDAANYGFDVVNGPQGQMAYRDGTARDVRGKEWRLDDLIKLIG